METHIKKKNIFIYYMEIINLLETFDFYQNSDKKDQILEWFKTLINDFNINKYKYNSLCKNIFNNKYISYYSIIHNIYLFFDIKNIPNNFEYLLNKYNNIKIPNYITNVNKYNTNFYLSKYIFNNLIENSYNYYNIIYSSNIELFITIIKSYQKIIFF